MAVTLDNGQARLTIRPDLGAGATAYDFHDGNRWQPIFRRVPDDTDHPFQLSNILLVPFSGRVSGGGFNFDGQFHAIERNMPTEKYPIHGSGFFLPWTVTHASPDRMTLAISASGPGPFRYDAEMTYALDGAALDMRLSVVNHGIRLPFGLGFHPWFVRDPDTSIEASATDVWLEHEDHLPKALVPVREYEDMDFNIARPLPARWINNWFSGWNGRALIDWPSRHVGARITASDVLDKYVVFSPAADADFFCFEPVSHPVDAFNLSGGPLSHGLVALDSGTGITASMRIDPFDTTSGDVRSIRAPTL